MRDPSIPDTAFGSTRSWPPRASDSRALRPSARSMLTWRKWTKSDSSLRIRPEKIRVHDATKRPPLLRRSFFDTRNALFERADLLLDLRDLIFRRRKLL